MYVCMYVCLFVCMYIWGLGDDFDPGEFPNPKQLPNPPLKFLRLVNPRPLYPLPRVLGFGASGFGG